MDTNLAGMSAGAAKDYVFSHITQKKLNEKRLSELAAEAQKWKGRSDLAREKSAPDLAAQAEAQAAEIEGKIAALTAENDALKNDIAAMIRQIPALAAAERSIDPDLLLQELLIAAGLNPGDEDKLGRDRKFADLEKEAAAEDALAALKAKLSEGKQAGGSANGPAGTDDGGA